MFFSVGRVDLNVPVFHCATCNLSIQASNSDYINSDFFPGNLSSLSYLFTSTTLQLRKFMKYNSPSFSEMKFLIIFIYSRPGNRNKNEVNNIKST